MIAVTAYTEPVPVNPIASEPQKTQEPEENEEQSSFAEMLAGLLKNAEMNRADIQPQDFSDAEVNIDALAAAYLEKFDFSDDVRPPEIEGDLEIDFSGAEISTDFQNLLLSAEHLFASSEDFGNFPHEISNAKNQDSLAEFALGKNFSNLSAEQADIENSAQTYVAAQNAEAVLSELNKKARNSGERRTSEPLPKDEKQEPISSKEKPSNERLYFHNKPEESKSRLDEMRSRLRRDKVTFEVRDLRTETNNNNTQTRSFAVVETAASRANNSAGAQEITLELRLPNNNSGASQNMAQTSWETNSSRALENMLARELHQNFNGDIVRHASMALRDGGEGTIKIALRPESLGNVKIRLEMTENKVTGRIVVESEEALQAFRKELSALEQAFRDSGYADASLNLSLTADGAGDGTQEQEERSYAPQMAASRYDGPVEREALSVDVFFGRNGSINMLA